MSDYEMKGSSEFFKDQLSLAWVGIKYVACGMLALAAVAVSPLVFALGPICVKWKNRK